jgi:hypothetical protein
MGAVYQAKDLKRRGTLCAVKEMSLSMVPSEERAQAIQNFKFEAKMLWGLSHPNLPAFTNFFSEGQRYFLVMEYIDGRTLEDLLENQGSPFPERRVLRWAEELCDVLEYLHSQNPPIIFRDMKPGNVMLTRQGHIKLIDFGIARFFRPLAGHDTQQLGTPGYASPEQYGQSQTDERSDIYSLGMTLAHLLTNHLPESPIGVKAKNIRGLNPQVSPQVARALEKATAPDLEMRYESVAAFRRALSGAASFTFETGEVAMEPEELAELCARYPQEASEYLANGEIDTWLRDIGEEDLARAARRIRDSQTDPLVSVEQFLHVVVGPNARMRGFMPSVANMHYLDERAVGDGGAALLDYPDPVEVDDYQHGYGEQELSSPPPERPISTRLFPPAREPFVQVSPRTLDFGAVYPPGASAPLTITIRGYQGLHVSGQVYSTEPWIRINRNEFDGMNTFVEVSIQTAHLSSYKQYQGTVVVAPDGEEQEVAVTVNADVRGYSIQVNKRSPRQTVTPDEDDDEELDLLQYSDAGPYSTNGQVAMQMESHPSASLSSHRSHHSRVSDDLFADIEAAVDSDLVDKYGSPDADGPWEPCPLTPRQERWQRFGRACSSALMMTCFWYTWLMQYHTLLLPPSPMFIFVLTGLVPTAALGALIIYRRDSWFSRDTLNRAITGMACTLGFLAPINLAWQFLGRGLPTWLDLTVMLFVSALGAAFGATTRAHETLLAATNFGLRYVGYLLWPVMCFAGALGGVLGFFLAAGLSFGFFTLFGILVGAGIACALVWCVDEGRTRRPLRRRARVR